MLASPQSTVLGLLSLRVQPSPPGLRKQAPNTCTHSLSGKLCFTTEKHWDPPKMIQGKAVLPKEDTATESMGKLTRFKNHTLCFQHPLHFICIKLRRDRPGGPWRLASARLGQSVQRPFSGSESAKPAELQRQS